MIIIINGDARIRKFYASIMMIVIILIVVAVVAAVAIVEMEIMTANRDHGYVYIQT